MNNYDLSILKEKSKSYYRECEKDLLDIYEEKIDSYNIGLIMNYIIEKNVYEIYSFIEDKKNTVSSINNKLIKNKTLSKLYFKYLKMCIKSKGLKFFFKS